MELYEQSFLVKFKKSNTKTDFMYCTLKKRILLGIHSIAIINLLLFFNFMFFLFAYLN